MNERQNGGSDVALKGVSDAWGRRLLWQVPYNELCKIDRDGRIALWNHSIPLERTLILGAMALNKNKSDERTDKIQIVSGLLMSEIRIKEGRKMVEKRIKMHNLYIFLKKSRRPCPLHSPTMVRVV